MIRKCICVSFISLSFQKKRYFIACYGSYTEHIRKIKHISGYKELRITQCNMINAVEGKRGCWGLGEGEESLSIRSIIYAGIRGFEG